MTDHDLTNDAHRERCAECTATWAELEAISADARALPTLTPSRDLWAGIEARLDAPSAAAVPATLGATTAASPARIRAGQRWFAQSTMRFAAAAGLLMMVTAGVTWRIATGERQRDDASVAVGASDSAAAAAAAVSGDPMLVPVGNAEAFTSMDLEIRALQTLLDERRAQLEPQTIEVLERSMTLIDQAITESRAALAKDPASQFLAAQLARSYSTKLTLLRSTATMPVGT